MNCEFTQDLFSKDTLLIYKEVLDGASFCQARIIHHFFEPIDER
jgi:hypothetical protein